MRGIILAGGTGTRLRPVTNVVSKQLLPVYDKPMIHYPLSVLMTAGIRDILLISTPHHLDAYTTLLGDGTDLGIHLHYRAQDHPRGLAHALILGRDFIGDDQIALILGDNIFHTPHLADLLQHERRRLNGCTLFGYPVPDPHRYGIATLDARGHLTRIDEKPAHPTSNLAVTGLYLYDNEAVAMAHDLTPSPRGELEITDLNRAFTATGRARLVPLGPDATWFDTGTHDSLLHAAAFVRDHQHRHGHPLGDIQHTAHRMGYIDDTQLAELTRTTPTDRHLTAPHP
ncbi:sugar nucleotidyltransferase [Marinactinospora rubrisoli]|uniref:Glucose-1-phosphate thymidylyltransferase n=1 Tax=Marinactinospora rubrisoli TaxID=2715399 RepID=A0ABW2KMR7_9ACTN